MNSKQFAVVIVITFFVGMVWLIADIIFNTKASIPVSPQQETLLEPLTPTFNQRVLDIVDEETLSPDQVVAREGEVETSPEPTPIPTGPSIIVGPDQASESGEIIL